jgi:4-hydroxy-3-polyprenylbenzoate decarboxylase
MTTPRQRLIVGVTGASGIVYAIKLLQILKPMPNIETHLVMSKAAEQARHYETELSARELQGLADVHYAVQDITAPIASGSFRTLGMIVVPCSMRTLAEIATGLSSSLLTRAADVTLKERRRLVLLTRESPLHQVHIENMLKVTQMGGIIAPPMPIFYNHPQSLDDLVTTSVGRALDLFGIDIPQLKRWKEV